MKLTNNTQGPRVVNTVTGPVTLAPGESQDLELSKDEAKALDATKFLDAPTGQPSAATQPLGTGQQPTSDADAQVAELVDSNNKDQLLEIAETEGVEGVSADSNKTEIATAIVTARNADNA
jgi:hypothetical protein